MSDYIKREDAVKEIAEQMAFEASMETGNDYMGADYIDDAKEWLSECPSADVAPVVRCKDCKWRYQNQHLDVYCIHPHGMGYGIGDDWYCHHGERIDKDGE